MNATRYPVLAALRMPPYDGPMTADDRRRHNARSVIFVPSAGDVLAAIVADREWRETVRATMDGVKR